jgi:hypothetical protein
MPRGRSRDLTLSRAVSDSDSGEHRLPACRSRQLAETRIRDYDDNTRKNIAGKLPAIAGGQPAPPQSVEPHVSLVLEIET